MAKPEYSLQKTCGRCGQRKSIGDFHVASNAPDGRQHYCKGCTTEYARHRRDLNARKARAFMLATPPVCNWRLIPGYETRYAVTENGEVWSFPYQGKNGRWYGGGWVSPLSGTTYLQVNLHDENHQKKTWTVHRLVCRAFWGDPPTQDHQVAHNNGKHHDNRANNLRWATARENTADQYVHDVVRRGEKSGKAKLNTRKVRHIRNLRGRMTAREIGKRFGVSKSTIECVWDYRTWRHV